MAFQRFSYLFCKFLCLSLFIEWLNINNAFEYKDKENKTENENEQIDDEMNAGELFDKLSELGAKVLLDTVECVKNGTLKPVKQDDSQSTYASILTKELCPIDFSKSARDVHNHIRGLSPWPVATTKINGKLLLSN